MAPSMGAGLSSVEVPTRLPVSHLPGDQSSMPYLFPSMNEVVVGLLLSQRAMVGQSWQFGPCLVKN